MSNARHVVLIHGNWSRGEQLAAARAAFEKRGFTAHTPKLCYHELSIHEGAKKIASLSLRDYTHDLVAFVNSLDSPPLLVGHSMGGLLAQLVAARTPHIGLVAACPAPASGITGSSTQQTGACPARISYAYAPGPSRCIPRRSNGFGTGSPTRRPRTLHAQFMRVWSAILGVRSAKCSWRC
ncbi:alpha/beta hydrolase [Mycobacterium tilburgii]|uniref:alpha/beta hydrolase n=1 Tax=Mycobacterium tilburgii TaxID=44467 RepID=UPI003898FCCF